MNSTVTANGSHSEPRRACALPRIGLLTARGCLREGNWPVYAGDAATIHAIFEAGGSPIIIPTLPIVLGDYDPFGVLTDEDAFDDVFSVLWPTICSLDGLVLAGGGDVYSCFYGQVIHPQAGPPDLWRDLWERYFALAAWRLQMPTLGICRGMHVMNMVRGGGLVQDIRVAWPKTMPPLLRHQAKGRSSASHCAEHPLTIHPKSRLARLLHNRDERIPGRQSIASVPSQHHQIVGYLTPEADIVGYLAPSLAVGATAPDGVIEAIEDPDPHRYWMAVQFHPERVVSLGWALRLFTSFTAASLAYANQMPRLLTSEREEVRMWVRRFDAGPLVRQADEQMDVPDVTQEQKGEAHYAL